MRIDHQKTRPIVYGLILAIAASLKKINRKIEEVIVIVDNKHNIGLRLSLKSSNDDFARRKLYLWQYNLPGVNDINSGEKDCLLITLPHPKLVSIGEFILRLEKIRVPNITPPIPELSVAITEKPAKTTFLVNAYSQSDDV